MNKMSQINLFEVLNERFYLQEPVKLFEAFARRLMGIDDEDFHKAQKSGVPSSQLYKQAGNGLVVDVFALIISTMVKR